jgi:peptidoglycan/xylan/chitin deacetylase (PgdA/CDA1 family)
MRIQLAILLAVLLVCPCSAEAPISNSDQKQISLVFRYDDYSNISPTELEIKMLEEFQKHDLACTFAVIPYVRDKSGNDEGNVSPLSIAKAAILKKAMDNGFLEVALHGYTHESILRANGQPLNSEFAGVSYTSQKEKISRGKNLLERLLERRITTFVPPWNRYDLNTVKCLEELGFQNLSGDFREEVVPAACNVRLLPYTCTLPEMKEAVEASRRIGGYHSIIVVIHPFDFTGNKPKVTLEGLKALLGWTRLQKDIRVLTIDQAINEISDLSSVRFEGNKSYRTAVLLVPPLLRLNPGNLYVYLSSETLYSRNLLNKAWLFFGFVYFIILGISVLISFCAARSILAHGKIIAFACLYGTPALFISFFAFALHGNDFSYKDMLGLVVLFGACLGIWADLFKRRKILREHDQYLQRAESITAQVKTPTQIYMR